MCKLGEGTFSEVLKVKHKKSGKIFAMKRFRKHFQSYDEVETLREIQALRRLNPHMNVVDLMDVIYDPKHGILSLNFELMECNLYELISKKNTTISESKAKMYFWQICKAVEYMHGKGIFHRDIKPENILVADNLIKLADFGSCRGIHSKPPFTEYIATRWYRSPECLLCDGMYNYKMDVWGAGCVLFEIVSKVPLFPGSNELDQLHRIHAVVGTPSQKVLKHMLGNKMNGMKYNFPHREGTGIRALIQHVSNECVDLINLMLAYDPDDRITSKEALKHPFFRDVHLYLAELGDTYIESVMGVAAAKALLSRKTHAHINSANILHHKKIEQITEPPELQQQQSASTYLKQPQTIVKENTHKNLLKNIDIDNSTTLTASQTLVDGVTVSSTTKTHPQEHVTEPQDAKFSSDENDKSHNNDSKTEENKNSESHVEQVSEPSDNSAKSDPDTSTSELQSDFQKAESDAVEIAPDNPVKASETTKTKNNTDNRDTQMQIPENVSESKELPPFPQHTHQKHIQPTTQDQQPPLHEKQHAPIHNENIYPIQYTQIQKQSSKLIKISNGLPSSDLMKTQQQQQQSALYAKLKAQQTQVNQHGLPNHSETSLGSNENLLHGLRGNVDNQRRLRKRLKNNQVPNTFEPKKRIGVAAAAQMAIGGGLISSQKFGNWGHNSLGVVGKGANGINLNQHKLPSLNVNSIHSQHNQIHPTHQAPSNLPALNIHAGSNVGDAEKGPKVAMLSGLKHTGKDGIMLPSLTEKQRAPARGGLASFKNVRDSKW
ncbi:hypothetical protein HK098_000853 [Nowakowskiella sp. JEL0407]|nr:hypothetical protein HK098_000853 [Nowakowskiella sp. JEL0407]